MKACVIQEAYKKLQKLFILVRMAGKHDGVPIHLDKVNSDIMQRTSLSCQLMCEQGVAVVDKWCWVTSVLGCPTN